MDHETEVGKIASSISDEIKRQVDLRVKSIMEEGGKDEWIAWFRAELADREARIEELEIELECMMNAFPDNTNVVQPKRRGRW
jgi:hypothetical protein